MTQIGDLIEVPAVKTVIELASVRTDKIESPDEQHLRAEIADTFVITDDIKLNLESILRSIIKAEGRGFFLSGSFGSGKSHFLAALSLLLTYPSAWEPLVAQEPGFEALQKPLSSQKYSVIQIPLLEHSANESLEYIIFDAIEKTLNRRWGFDLILTEEEYFLEMFERYILPAFRGRINHFIEQELGAGFDWQTLRSEPKDLVSLAQRFLMTTEEEVPFRLTPQRSPAFDKIMSTLSQHQFSGLVILLDELSEFLKSKSTNAQLNEDARFLQFIGERTLSQPIWIIGALQEAIEKTGDIQKSVFDKIKDRYRTRLELSTRHIRELIDRRLVLKKKNATQAIKEAFTILKSSFNNIRITEDIFLQIYPVHPECLELLDLSEGLFSQRRGVVDFIHFQLKGDPLRHIDGMLSADYLELLTPDKIFDHFYVQIKENPQTSQFYTIFRDHFRKRIPEIFEAENDANCALKAIKILILLEILPVKQRRTVQELANMILYRSTDLSLGDINYEYFEEAILKRLEKELGYLKVEPQPDKFKNIYQFDVGATARDVIAERIQIYQSSVRGKHRELIETIFPNLESSLFPWGQLLNVESHRNYIKWMNSIREGRVILSDARDFDSAAFTRIINRLETTEDDFFVIFGYPFDQNEQLTTYQTLVEKNKSNRFCAGIICILPTVLNANEWEALELYYSTFLVWEDYQNDHTEEGLEIKSRLDTELKRLQREARLILETAYSNGSLHSVKGRIDQGIREITDQSFDAILMRIITHPLEMVYPMFHIIAPLEEISSFTVLKELLNQFIQPGGIEDLNQPQYRLLRHAIDNIAVPLGIAEIKGRKCVLQGETRFSAGLNAIYELVEPNQRVEYHELFIQLRNSEYGMTRFIFDLLLMVLFRKGHLVAQHDEQTLSPYQLQFPLYKYIDSVARGQLIAPEYREKLTVIARSLIKENLTDYDIQKQEAVWAKFCDFQERAATFLEKVRLRLQILKQKYNLEATAIKHTTEALSTLELISNNINRTLGSKTGLEKLITSVEQPDQLRYSLDQMRVLNKFFETGVQEFERIYSYVHNPQLVIPENDAYQELLALQDRIKTKLVINDEMLLEEGLRYVRGLFTDFLDIYKSRYAQEHELRKQAIDVDALTQLQNSAEFQILNQLAKITIISVQDDFGKINRLIEDYKLRVCQLPVSDTLEHFVQCRCGFQLGEKMEAVDTKSVRQQIENGIRQYLTALQESQHRSQIERYLRNMLKLNKPVPATSIRAILNLSPNQTFKDILSELEQHLNPQVIEHINQALSGDVVIITRNIDHLFENLVDRRYTREKVLQIVDEWLKGQEAGAENVYIEIVTGKRR